MPQPPVCDTYLIDTFRNAASGKYCPGAITFQKRRKIEALQWKDREFMSQQEANTFVREQLSSLGLREVRNEDELRR